MTSPGAIVTMHYRITFNEVMLAHATLVPRQLLEEAHDPNSKGYEPPDHPPEEHQEEEVGIGRRITRSLRTQTPVVTFTLSL